MQLFQVLLIWAKVNYQTAERSEIQMNRYGRLSKGGRWGLYGEGMQQEQGGGKQAPHGSCPSEMLSCLFNTAVTEVGCSDPLSDDQNRVSTFA